MRFYACHPSYPLSEFVELFTFYDALEVDHRIERLLPEGVIEIIFDLTETPKFIYDNQELTEIQQCRNVWVSGMRKGFISISAIPGSSMLVIRFKPGKAWPFLRFPLKELNNSVIDGEAVFGKDILLLRKKILEEPAVEKKIGLAELFLLKKAGCSLHLHPAVSYAVDTILQQPETASIRRIVQKTGYSHKHLICLFDKYVGLNPKEFLRIQRFQKTIRQIEQKSVQEVDWTRISFDCGYYDQAHFINDFKLFSGFTPNAYLLNKGEYINYVPVA